MCQLRQFLKKLLKFFQRVRLEVYVELNAFYIIFTKISLFMQVVGITVGPPPTMPPSPRSSTVANKKWSSLPSKSTEETLLEAAANESPAKIPNGSPFDSFNEWKTLNTETNFVCVDTLSNLCSACKGEDNEMREVIRTSLDVAKAAEDTRAMLSTLQNLAQVEELAAIVFAKGKIIVIIQ
jgi:hypothetical protein